MDHGDILSGASDVQVQRGIGNSLSSTAFGGAVNVESDINKLDPGVNIQLGYGNFIDGNALDAPSGKRSISYAGDLFPNKGISASFRFSDLSSSGYRIGSGTEQQSAQVSLQWSQPTHRTRAEYLWGHEKTRFSWDGVSPQYGYDLDDMDERRYNFYADTTYQGGYADVNQDVFTQSIALISHTHILSEHLKLDGTLYHIGGKGYYQQFKGRSDPVAYNLTQILEDSSVVDLIRRKWLDNRYGGGVFRLNYLLPKHMITAGGDLRFYGSGHYGEVTYVEDYGSIPADHRFYNNATRKSSYSFFVRDLVSLSDRLFLQGDVRFLTHRFRVKQDTIGFVTEPYHFILSYPFLDGHLGLRYNVSDRLSTFINVSTSKREPSSNDIYDDGDPTVPAAVEDPYSGTLTEPLIRHESLIDTEWGVDYMGENLRLALNLYRMDFRNELIPVYYRYRDTDQVLRGNAPRTLHQGAEFVLDLEAGDLRFRGNMTLSDNHFVEFTADSLGWGGYGGIADYAGKQIPAFPRSRPRRASPGNTSAFIPG
ncbi:MAG: TonB-dependent receptor [Candidatus Marinimicrobia bacterium]|nr:TonB-dependent receptor [Candidatus Neomarinimicrobiota bacterium]